MCDCDRALERISLRMDGMLSPAEMAELEAHLADCPHCGAAAQALEEIHAAMPQLIEAPPEGFRQRVMERIAAERVVPFSVKKTGTRVWKTWLSTVAVFAVILLGGSSLLRSGLLGTAPGAAPPPPAPMASSAPAHDAATAQGAPQAQMYAGGEGSGQETDTSGGETGKEILPAPAGGPTQPSPLPTMAPQEAPASDQVYQNGAAPGAQENDPVGEPRTVQARMPTPAESAAQQLGEVQWPGAVITLLYDEAGGLLGLQVAPEEGQSVTLACLGLSPNGLYCEFQPDGQEADRFAVALDGTGILSRQSDQAAYDAEVAE